MSSNLKALGLTLVAVFAMSALVTQVAQAHIFKSDSANGKTVITGEDEPGFNDVFTATGKVECQKAVYQGTFEGNEKTELTIHTTRSECTAAGQPMTFTTNDCAEIFTGNTDASGDAPIHIECAAGNSMETNIPSLKVVLKIGEQTPEGGVHYVNLKEHPSAGNKEAVTVETTVKGIAVKCFGNGVEGAGNCFLFGKTAALSGKDWFTGYEDKGPAETNPTTPGSTTTKEGARVNFTTV